MFDVRVALAYGVSEQNILHICEYHSDSLRFQHRHEPFVEQLVTIVSMKVEMQ
jgi:hypothetical protein